MCAAGSAADVALFTLKKVVSGFTSRGGNLVGRVRRQFERRLIFFKEIRSRSDHQFIYYIFLDFD
jgi:hypothetical protein